MLNFIYIIEENSKARGFNQTIRVWRVRNNRPEFIGRNNKINTAATYGPKPEAMQIIRDNTHLKMDGSYSMVRKDIRLTEV